MKFPENVLTLQVQALVSFSENVVHMNGSLHFKIWKVHFRSKKPQLSQMHFVDASSGALIFICWCVDFMVTQGQLLFQK